MAKSEYSPEEIALMNEVMMGDLLTKLKGKGKAAKVVTSVASKPSAAVAAMGKTWGSKVAKSAGTAATAATAGATATGETAAPGLLKLLTSGQFGTAIKAHPGVAGIGGVVLLSLLLSKLSGLGLQNKAENIRRGGVQSQLDRSPEDMYYQAAMPELSAERQQAQDALMQMILAGRGQDIQVPGERRI